MFKIYSDQNKDFTFCKFLLPIFYRFFHFACPFFSFCLSVYNGISGNVDLDVCYRDYPDTIQAKGLNGFPKSVEKPVETVEKKSIEVVADIDGVKYSGTLSKRDEN